MREQLKMTCIQAEQSQAVTVPVPTSSLSPTPDLKSLRRITPESRNKRVGASSSKCACKCNDVPQDIVDNKGTESDRARLGCSTTIQHPGDSDHWDQHIDIDINVSLIVAGETAKATLKGKTTWEEFWLPVGFDVLEGRILFIVYRSLLSMRCSYCPYTNEATHHYRMDKQIHTRASTQDPFVAKRDENTLSLIFDRVGSWGMT